MSGKRPIAPRLARPANRYYKGKAPKGVSAAALSDESEEEQQEGEEQEQEQDERLGGDESIGEGGLAVDRDAGARRGAGRQGLNVRLGRTEIVGGRVIVDGRAEVGRTKVEEEEEEESEEEEARATAGEESSEDETESEEEEEEEEKPKVLFRPVFVPKRGRETVLEKEAESVYSEEAMLKREKEEEERRKLSKALVAESIKRELAEKEAPDLVPDVDDTDGLDPSGEFEAWRLRELARIKRDKEAELEREREREELERRRAMPEEQRLREDLARAKQSRDEKAKGQQKFLQKYWHKGAFHQEEEILKRHDYTEATESTVDVSVLPKVMQVKNFGKRSQTKYTHLLDQDTTAGTGGFGGKQFYKNGRTGPGPGVFAQGQGQGQNGQGGSGCYVCGGPHMKKDCPQLARGGNGPSVSGANSRELGESKWGRAPRDERDRNGARPPYEDRDRERERDREPRAGAGRGPEPQSRRADDRGFRRSRSRSGSPAYRSRPRSPPYGGAGAGTGRDVREEEGYRRPRSRSREDVDMERERERDKRRRVY